MINWKLRFKNKATLIALITALIAFVYQVLALFEVVPKISEDMVTQLLMIVVNVLATLGIITDPTTSGISDSTQALTYNEPK